MNPRIVISLIVPIVYLVLFAMLMQRLGSGDRVSVRLRSIEELDVLGIPAPEMDNSTSSFLDRVVKPAIENLSRAISANVPIGEEAQGELAENLKLAGWDISPQTYIGLVILIAFVVMIPLGIMLQLIGLLLGALGTYVIARFMLKAQIQKRRREIENSLPDTLDLLSSCVSAGLGFDQGLLHVIKRTDGPLTDELAQAQREIAMGVPRHRRSEERRVGKECRSRWSPYH